MSDAMITFVVLQVSTALITVVGMILTYMKSQQAVTQSEINTKKADGLHAVFNSRLTELVESKQREAHAQGVIAGGLAQIAMDDHRTTEQLSSSALKAQAMLVAEALKAQAILVETARQIAADLARKAAEANATNELEKDSETHKP